MHAQFLKGLFPTLPSIWKWPVGVGLEEIEKVYAVHMLSKVIKKITLSWLFKSLGGTEFTWKSLDGID